MSSSSAIEWTDATWNPVTGCSRVSPGCAHCYALDLAPKLQRFARGNVAKAITAGRDPPRAKWLDVRDGGVGSGPAFGVTLHPAELEQPLRWTKPRRIFVNSMSDLFHEEVPDEFICRVFAAMAAAPQHTFQVLTKRPERMRGWFAWEGKGINRCGTVRNQFDFAYARQMDAGTMDRMARRFPWPLPNVWLGVSIENRRFVARADVLRETPAAVRFISAEPLLGPLVGEVECGRHEGKDATHGRAAAGARQASSAGSTFGTGSTIRTTRPARLPSSTLAPALDLTGIDWLIVGGESGPHARRIDPDWVRALRDACLEQRLWEPGTGPDPTGRRTAFFFKQWGGRTPKPGGRDLGGRTWDEFPAAGAVVLA